MTIKFTSSEARFLGRNGYFKSSGLEVGTVPCFGATLTPITSKGLVARCSIEIPADAIDATIKALQAAKTRAR